MGRQFLFSFFSYLLLVSCPLSAITLDAFLDASQSRHPLFKNEDLSVAIRRSSVLLEQGGQDWQIGLGATYQDSENTPASIFDPVTTQSTSLSARASKSIWKTGGRLQANLANSYYENGLSPELLQNFGTEAIPNTFHTNTVSLSYTQPLLKNRGGQLSRLGEELQILGIEIDALTASENKEVFLGTLANGFLDWVFLEEQARIFKQRLKIAEENLLATEEKRRRNVVTEVDLLRQEDAVRIAKQNVLLASGQTLAKQSELATLIAYPDIYDASPEFDLYGKVTLPSLNYTLIEIEQTSRLIKALRVQESQRKLEYSAALNNWKADVSLTGAVGLQDGAVDFEESADFDKSVYSIGVDVNFPVGNKAGAAQIQRSAQLLSQLALTVDAQKQQLNAAQINLLIQLKTLQDVMALNRQQIKSATEKTVAEKRLYDQGRSQLTFLIQARDNVLNAELGYAQNALQFHKLWIEYLALTDQLLKAS